MPCKANEIAWVPQVISCLTIALLALKISQYILSNFSLPKSPYPYPVVHEKSVADNFCFLKEINYEEQVKNILIRI